MHRRDLLALAASAAALPYGQLTGASAPPASVQPLVGKLPSENDGKLEVLEFFHYACGFCHAIHAELKAWAKRQPSGVRLTLVPSLTPIANINAAELHFTLQALGHLNRLADNIYADIHIKQMMLGHKGTLTKWLTENGVKPTDYAAAAQSFSVVNRVKRAQQLASDYVITGLPTFVVAGRTKVNNGVGVIALLDKTVKASLKQS